MLFKNNNLLLKVILATALFFLSKPCFAKEKSISLLIGQTGGSGYSQESSPFVSWKYSYIDSFFSVTGGSQYSSGICDNTVQIDFFKDFMSSIFQIRLSGGAIYHAGIMIKKSFLQDEHITISCLFKIKPIGLSLYVFGGCGFNNTYTTGFWMNDFYPILSADLNFEFLKNFSIQAKFSSFDFFNFDGFPCYRFSFYFSAVLTEKLSSTLGFVIRYTNTDINSHLNYQVDHIDFKAVLTYAL